MRLVSRFALGAALAVSCATSGGAQQANSLDKNERAAIHTLKTALDARNYPAAEVAVRAAQNAATSSYARYVASALQLRLGAETSNRGMQSTAIDAMIGSGAAPASELPQLYRSQATLLLDAGKYERAEAALTRAIEVAPGGEVAPADADLLLALAEVKLLRKKNREALPLMIRAIDLRRNSGQAVPESWYKRAAATALANGAFPEAVGLTRNLVAAFPTHDNWRDAILAYRDAAAADPAARIDALRLLRETKSLAGERDYQLLAQSLSDAGLNIEARAVLDQGVAAGMVDPAKATFKELLASTAKQAATERKALAGLEAKANAATTGTAALTAADAHLGAGQYAKAAALYQAALQKGGVDAGVASMRLGIAHALAGQKIEAESAFRSVNGPRTDLGSLWLVWLGQQA